MISVTFSLNVPALPDNDVWFANAAAWSNYWSGISVAGTLDSVDTVIYAASAYNSALEPFYLNLDGVTTHILVTQDMFTSLLNRVNALNSAFETMRTELRNAGLITNAQ